MHIYIYHMVLVSPRTHIHTKTHICMPSYIQSYLHTYLPTYIPWYVSVHVSLDIASFVHLLAGQLVANSISSVVLFLDFLRYLHPHPPADIQTNVHTLLFPHHGGEIDKDIFSPLHHHIPHQGGGLWGEGGVGEAGIYIYMCNIYIYMCIYIYIHINNFLYTHDIYIYIIYIYI